MCEPTAGATRDQHVRDPSMVVRETADGQNVEHACANGGTSAAPAVRLLETAQGLEPRGARIAISSICELTLDPSGLGALIFSLR